MDDNEEEPEIPELDDDTELDTTELDDEGEDFDGIKIKNQQDEFIDLPEEDEEGEEDDDQEDQDDKDLDDDEEIIGDKEDIKLDYSDLASNIFNISDDLEINDSSDFLQKFSNDLKDEYIINHHPECLSKNFEEIKILSKVTRDKNNIIIDDMHKTLPILTKYEKTRIIGIRLKQLNNNCKSFINIGENIIDNLIIANKELEEKKLPFIIQRPIPNNTFEYWRLQDLEII